MLTAAEAAKVLGLKPRTMYDLAKAGKIACEYGPLRFDRAVIEAYKASCRVTQFVGPLKPVPPAPYPWDDPDSAVARYFQGKKGMRAP